MMNGGGSRPFTKAFYRLMMTYLCKCTFIYLFILFYLYKNEVFVLQVSKPFHQKLLPSLYFRTNSFVTQYKSGAIQVSSHFILDTRTGRLLLEYSSIFHHESGVCTDSSNCGVQCGARGRGGQWKNRALFWGGDWEVSLFITLVNNAQLCPAW